VELRNDVSPVQEPVVEEPPYRMVPGNDAVCTRDVLRRFHAMKMQPSRNQQRKKGKWNRGDVNGMVVSDILAKHGDTILVNATGSHGGLRMSEYSGHHVTFVGRIREVHVRWHGDPALEQKYLDKFAEILRQTGYTVKEAEENNVDWPPGHSRNFVLNRRNRKYLRVAKFHHQRQKR
jgi:hypothetical protein